MSPLQTTSITFCQSINQPTRHIPSASVSVHQKTSTAVITVMSSPKQLGVLNDVRKRRRQLTETLLGQADEFQRIRELEKTNTAMRRNIMWEKQ